MHLIKILVLLGQNKKVICWPKQFFDRRAKYFGKN